MKGREGDIDWDKIGITKFLESQFRKQKILVKPLISVMHISMATRISRDQFLRSVHYLGDRNFMNGSNFYRAEFTLADFKGVHFNQGTNFSKFNFQQESIFCIF